MNVDQLISEGWKKLLNDVASGSVPANANSQEACFGHGVRHALAAMFEVVKVEDVEVDKLYFAKERTVGLWHEVRLQRWAPSHDVPKLMFFTIRDHLPCRMEFTEFRRCPTPGDAGIANA